MPELALDDVERHALARELERVGVPELVRDKAPPDADRPREAAELDAHAGCAPGVAAGGPVDHAEERPDRQLEAELEPALA